MLSGLNIWRIARSAAFIITVSWVIFVAFLYVYQRRLLFFPDAARVAHRQGHQALRVAGGGWTGHWTIFVLRAAPGQWPGPSPSGRIRILGGRVCS